MSPGEILAVDTRADPDITVNNIAAAFNRVDPVLIGIIICKVQYSPGSAGNFHG